MSIIIEENDIRIEKLVLSPYETNCYIIVCKKTNKSAVVDAPADASAIISALNGTDPKYIFLTHGHYDHTGTMTSLRARLKAPLAAHAADSAVLKTPPEIFVNDGDIFKAGRLTFTAFHTPGHTPGSLCFKVGKYLIAGDTLFPGGPGHTDTPEDFREIIESITGKIFTLPGGTVILPGHGGGTAVKNSREEYEAFASRSHSDGLCGDVLWASS